MANMEHSGVLVDVDVSGVGVVEDDESHVKYVFTFDKVKGYVGQSLGAAGLKAGRRVTFVADEDFVEVLEVARG